MLHSITPPQNISIWLNLILSIQLQMLQFSKNEQGSSLKYIVNYIAIILCSLDLTELKMKNTSNSTYGNLLLTKLPIHLLK